MLASLQRPERGMYHTGEFTLGIMADYDTSSLSASTLKLAYVGMPMHATRNDGSRKSDGVWIYILPVPK